MQNSRKEQTEVQDGSNNELVCLVEAFSSLSSSNLALVKHVETVYGDTIEDLCKYKDKAEFCAKYRDIVSEFESCAFLLMCDGALYTTALQQGLTPLESSQSLLAVLSLIRHAKLNPSLPASAALLQSPKAQLPAAWDAAVVAAGLSLEEYKQLREFKGMTNQSFHQAISHPEALQELQSSVPLPEDCARYKDVLLKALRLL